MIRIDNKKQYSVKVTELEKKIIRECLEQMPLIIAEFYGKTFINLRKKFK